MSTKSVEELTDLAIAALRQAARDAAKIARDTGTPLIVKEEDVVETTAASSSKAIPVQN